MARPLKNEHEKKVASLPPVALTTAERNHVEDMASTAGLSITEFVRVSVLTSEVKPRKTKLEASLLVELNRIGVNLNQLTHAANIGRTDEAKLSYAIDELVMLMKRLDAAL